METVAPPIAAAAHIKKMGTRPGESGAFRTLSILGMGPSGPFQALTGAIVFTEDTRLMGTSRAPRGWSTRAPAAARGR